MAVRSRKTASKDGGKSKPEPDSKRAVKTPAAGKPAGMKTLAVQSTAEAYLELLRDRGIEYLFANGGTDFAPIVESLAKLSIEKRLGPKPITVPHEFCAVSMAHGYYLVTGRPQGVMVHVIVGAANATGAIMNAARANVPIIFTAGRTPLLEEGPRGSRNVHIHWAQESFDQGALLREFVKWDYELKNAQQLEQVVDRAMQMAMTQPRGPVYLTLPREVLAQELTELRYTPRGKAIADGLAHPLPAGVKEAADLIQAASDPVVITSAAGRFPEGLSSLVRLAESWGLPVVEMNRQVVNFPTTHALHCGYDSTAFVKKADVIVVAECDVPWFPSRVKPKATAKVIQIGVDPHFSRYPMRSFPFDVAITAEAPAAFLALNRELGRYKAERKGAVTERLQAYRGANDERRAALKAAVLKKQNRSDMDFDWVTHCINLIKDDETIIVNEYDLNPHHAQFTKPGTFFGSSPAGGLGWGFGAALGAKLAAPAKTVIATLGDGAYMFNVPTACHWVSRAYGLPILVVIFNNQGWNAVKFAAQNVYPDGYAVSNNEFPICNLDPAPEYHKIALAFGGYGEMVDQPDEVVPALRRALKVVREEKRQAVVNVLCRHI
ncbi:MAG: thiamine pyrophosphate-requiring protein [Candidatus Tectomicrobia bacterium]|nr:thiamine pyrophosphate-requiring protein [Candidatus Tectomicrobia bacterium]